MDADRVQLRLVEEPDFGDTPNGQISAATIAAVALTSRFTDSGDGLGVFKVNQMVEVSGFTNTQNNGNFKVLEVADGYITVDKDLTDEAAGDTIEIKTAMEEIRFTSEDLKQDTNTVRSTEITPDRQVSCVKRVDINASGAINHEFSAKSFDKMLEAVLMSTGFSEKAEVTLTTLSMAESDNSINDSGDGFVAAGFLPNQWIKTSGFADPENNGFFKIVSVATGKMVLKGKSVKDEAAGESVTVTMLPQIVNGVAKRSFTIEREYTDAPTTEIAQYAGCMFESWEINAIVEAIITGVFNVIGKREESKTESAGQGDVIIHSTDCPMAAVDEFYSVLENYEESEATNIGFTIANNLRSRKVLGKLGAQSIGTGKVEVTGRYEKYFESQALMNKYLAFETTALSFILQDGEGGNAVIFDIPSVKFSSGTRVAGGENTDIMAVMEFEANRASAEDITIRIAKFDA